jgi:hypothetical protein
MASSPDAVRAMQDAALKELKAKTPEYIRHTIPDQYSPQTLDKLATVSNVQKPAEISEGLPLSIKEMVNAAPKLPSSAAPTVAAPVTGVDDPNKKKTPAPEDLTKTYSALLQSYKNLGKDQQEALRTSMGTINGAIKELNDGFEMQMADAKGKAEKDKTRAEWASIASMLAKNIIGFAAAQQGVSPNAMAYETMDWGKRIADIESNLKNDIGILRDTMRDKVNNKRIELQGEKEMSDVNFKSKLEGLKGRTDLLKLSMDKEEAAAKVAKEERDRLVSTYKPEDVTKVIDSIATAKSFSEALQIASTNGVDDATMKKAKKLEGGAWLNPFDGDKNAALKVRGDAIRENAAARGGLKTTVKTEIQPGQPTTNVVPSAQPITTQDEYNALPSGARFVWNGKNGIKP